MDIGHYDVETVHSIINSTPVARKHLLHEHTRKKRI